MISLHVYFYCKTDSDKKEATEARAYKYINRQKDTTPANEAMIYSYKAKRYIIARFYKMDWRGNQDHAIKIERNMMRGALRRIGLDIR